MDNEARCVGVGQDELDALNFFLPEHDATPTPTGRFPAVEISSAASLSDSKHRPRAASDVAQRDAATVVNQRHRPPVISGQQRQHAMRFRKPRVLHDILTTIAIQTVVVGRWLLASWHKARLHTCATIARTRVSLREVNAAFSMGRSSLCTYVTTGLADSRARFRGLAAGLRPGWLHGHSLRRQPRWSAASFFGGVLVGALLIQLVPMRSLDSPSARELKTTSLRHASPASTAVVATTFVQAPPEADATSPVPAATSSPSGFGGARNYRGGLKIDSQPAGATVFVNNQRVGQTPIALPSLSAGSRAVRLELNGHAPWSRSVRIVANQSTRVSARLEPRR